MKSRLCLTFLSLLCCLSCSVFAQDDSSGITVTTVLKTTTTWEGKPIVYPSGQPEITGMMIEIAPGKETGWHEHPIPSFAVLMEGTLEVTLRGGQVKRLQPGDSLADVINTLHNGRSLGDRPVKILVFYAGAVGTPLTIKHPKIHE